MRIISEVLAFCNDCTFFDQYKTARVVETNHVRVFKINVFLESDHIDENFQIGVLGSKDDIPLMVIDGNVEKLFHEMNDLRGDFSQWLCLEKI